MELFVRCISICLDNTEPVVIAPHGATTSWITASTWGATDVTGTSNFYIEDCDFHAFEIVADADDNGCAWYFGTTCLIMLQSGRTERIRSELWQPQLEVYDSEFAFNGTNGETMNLNFWFYLRGGTMVVSDCIMPDITFAGLRQQT